MIYGAYVIAQKNLQNHFIYLGNKEIYYICCIISISLSTNHALKFKHQLNCLKANKIQNK